MRRRGPDPVLLEVYRNHYEAIAEEMGAALQRTAFSPNIKERRDFSCALFDGAGRLVAQGDHMPVHLGSMPASVREAIRARPPGPGDIVLLNDPFRGGTHLPDLTMVSAVFREGDRRPFFHLATRAHHADVGGMSPGSMPLAREIYQEGIRIPPVMWSRGGGTDRDLRELILANVRTPEERSGDLEAQVAAHHCGGARLRELADDRGPEELLAYAGHLQDLSERRTRETLRTIPPGVWRFEDVLDDDGFGASDLWIRVAIQVRGGKAIVDFAGSSPQVAGPVNAVLAITISAVVYVFRCLGSGDIPMNEGCLRPLQVRAPEGTIVNAVPPAAVAAGNVETSQRITDVLLGALAAALPGRIPAASQGTMNNVAIGGTDPRTGRPFAYYETVAGGMGARPSRDGISGVHTHMTNSRNTPIEALEHAVPVRVRRYALRRGSGGRGLRRGGEGLVRVLELLAPAAVTILSDRREHPPWGLQGGEPGRTGENRVHRRCGAGLRPERVPGKWQGHLGPGDLLEIATPGGGGWGGARGGRGGRKERVR